MADEEKKSAASRHISEDQRFKYIGFEVFPGKARDIFRSPDEKKKLVDKVIKKRARLEALHHLREECTLLEERVTMTDRIILAVACAAMLVALFLPWYSAYNEIVSEETVPTQTETEAAVVDSGLVADSASLAMVTDSLDAGTDEGVDTATAAGVSGEEGAEAAATHAPAEEIIHGYVAKKKIHKEYERLSGVGAFAALGSVGSYVFGSGGILAITAVIFMVMTLLTLGLPLYTLLGLFGSKGNADQAALKLKKVLKLNWLPLVCFLVAVILSFLGGDYGFDSQALFSSVGSSYGPAVLFDSLSWGVFLSIAASIMLAVKGIEI